MADDAKRERKCGNYHRKWLSLVIKDITCNNGIIMEQNVPKTKRGDDLVGWRWEEIFDALREKGGST